MQKKPPLGTTEILNEIVHHMFTMIPHAMDTLPKIHDLTMPNLRFAFVEQLMKALLASPFKENVERSATEIRVLLDNGSVSTKDEWVTVAKNIQDAMQVLIDAPTRKKGTGSPKEDDKGDEGDEVTTTTAEPVDLDSEEESGDDEASARNKLAASMGLDRKDLIAKKAAAKKKVVHREVLLFAARASAHRAATKKERDTLKEAAKKQAQTDAAELQHLGQEEKLELYRKREVQERAKKEEQKKRAAENSEKKSELCARGVDELSTLDLVQSAWNQVHYKIPASALSPDVTSQCGTGHCSLNNAFVLSLAGCFSVDGSDIHTTRLSSVDSPGTSSSPVLHYWYSLKRGH